ncbi:MAG: thiamine-phosphate kinase [Proteobacteria bacterium]|nr:thiamine-phosphate kinase [Pseudomonadota bacterium]
MVLPNILGKEFDCINKIIAALPSGGRIGDDCAVIRCENKSMLVSVDTFVEDVHFSLKYFKLDEVGQRCCEASLSDIAAMGGKALYATFSISVPDHKMIDAVAMGVKRSLVRHKVKIIGGDTTFSKSIILSFTVIGIPSKTVKGEKPIYRSGAKPGDSVYTSSYTGLSEGGLYALKNRIKGFNLLKLKHKKPLARLDIASKISKYANSMIDISDGLVSELYHLAYASNVSIVIDKIPVHSELKKLGIASKIDPKIMAFYGGEDFELLYTTSKKSAQKTIGLCLGKVIKKNGNNCVYFKDAKGKLASLPPGIGFKHFK